MSAADPCLEFAFRVRRHTPFRAYVFFVSLLSTAACVGFLVAPRVADDQVMFMDRDVFLVLQAVAVIAGWAGFVQVVRRSWGWATFLLLGFVLGPLTPALHIYGGLILTAPPSLAAAAMAARTRIRDGS